MPRKKRSPAKRSAPSKTNDRDLQLVMQMMAIRGSSGDERQITDLVIKRLRAAGAPPEAITREPPPKHSKFDTDCGNVILKLSGSVRGPRRLFAAHLDTVPVCVGSQPVIKGRYIVSADPNTGLGGDDRSGAAVLLLTAVALLRGKREHPPITFLWNLQA